MEYKLAREEEAEQALALARRDYNRRRAALEDARMRLESALNRDGNFNHLKHGKRASDPAAGIHFYLYLEKLKRDILHLTEGLERAGRKVEKKREQLIKARQECKILEKLKEKQLQAFRMHELALEQKEQDELAGLVCLRER